MMVPYITNLSEILKGIRTLNPKLWGRGAHGNPEEVIGIPTKDSRGLLVDKLAAQNEQAYLDQGFQNSVRHGLVLSPHNVLGCSV